MRIVAELPTGGTIAWSNGHGIWHRYYGYPPASCSKRGYWAVATGGRAEYIGQDVESVHRHLEGIVAVRRKTAAALIERAIASKQTVLEKTMAFDQTLRAEVLDLIVADLEKV
jgi:hypothetical protein